MLNLTVTFSVLSESNFNCVARLSDEEEARSVIAFSVDERDLELFRHDVLSSAATTVRQMAQLRPDTRMRLIGTKLFEAAFPAGPVRFLYLEAHRRTARSSQQVRIRLQFPADSILASLPWEFAFDPDRALPVGMMRNFSILRCPVFPEAVAPLAVAGRLRVLVAVSKGVEPHGNTEGNQPGGLDVAAEVGAMFRVPNIEVDQVDAHSLDHVVRRLEQRDYHIFHYIGHAWYDAGLGQCMFAIRHGNGFLRATDLGIALHRHRSLRLVVLNACESATTDHLSGAGAAQTLILNRLLAVVAMQFAISDRAAIHFAKQFYKRLGDSGSVDDAVAAGREGIHSALSGFEWGTPTLFTRSSSPYLFDPASSPTKPHIRWLWIVAACVLIAGLGARLKFNDWTIFKQPIIAEHPVATPVKIDAPIGAWRIKGSMKIDVSVTELALSATGRLAAINRDDGIIRFFDKGAPSKVGSIQQGHCAHVVFSPDSRYVAIASTDHHTIVVDANGGEGQCLDCENPPGKLVGVGFPSLTSLLRLSANRAALFNIDPISSSRKVSEIPLPDYEPIALDKDGAKIVAKRAQEYFILKRVGDTIVVGPKLQDVTSIKATAFSKDRIVGATESRVLVWRADSGEIEHQYLFANNGPSLLAVADNWIVASFPSGKTAAWSMEGSEASFESRMEVLANAASSAIVLDPSARKAYAAFGKTISSFER